MKLLHWCWLFTWCLCCCQPQRATVACQRARRAVYGSLAAGQQQPAAAAGGTGHVHDSEGDSVGHRAVTACALCVAAVCECNAGVWLAAECFDAPAGVVCV